MMEKKIPLGCSVPWEGASTCLELPSCSICFGHAKYRRGSKTGLPVVLLPKTTPWRHRGFVPAGFPLPTELGSMRESSLFSSTLLQAAR